MTGRLSAVDGEPDKRPPRRPTVALLSRWLLWSATALGVLGGALAIWLGNADWGDGSGPDLEPIETLVLVIITVTAPIAAHRVDRSLRRRD